MARLYLKKNKNKNKQSQKEWVVGHLPTKGDALSSNLSTPKKTNKKTITNPSTAQNKIKISAQSTKSRKPQPTSMSSVARDLVEVTQQAILPHCLVRTGIEVQCVVVGMEPDT
jgi:hypothetical protein